MIPAQHFTLQDYIDAAKIICCDTAAVQAAAYVEGGGTGFLPSGKILLKFEGHIFHMYTKGIYDQSHPTISYPHWTEQYSQFGEASYLRFDQAFALNPHCAMFATSWGAFQIMGENYSSCGFKSVDEFVTYLKLKLENHLLAWCGYNKTERLDRFLIAHDWKSYAYRYNGALYQKNDYDGKLQRAYLKFKTP